MIKTVKKIFIFLFFLISFIVLEYGYEWIDTTMYLYPLFLAFLTTLALINPKARKGVLFLSLCFFGLMVLLYLLDRVKLSNIVGSFGFSLICIFLLSHSKELLTKGFIEKF